MKKNRKKVIFIEDMMDMPSGERYLLRERCADVILEDYLYNGLVLKEYDEDGNLVKEQKYHDKFGVFDKDHYDRFDIGMVAGVSLDIIDELSVGIEFTRGFKKLQSNLKQYNQSLGLVFEYKL